MAPKYHRIIGLFLTALLSTAVLALFYGNLFNKLNKVSFASGGDGLQSYVNMEYHIRYDTSYMRCNSMNYPYGEHVFFTSNQPLFSNTVKFISANIKDISDYTLGMLNFLMLFFLVITPIIMFLIFDHLGIGTLVSVIASVAIAYLSPQLDRFGGHFNLSYVAAIPWMILLLLKFFRKPSVLLTVLIFLSVLAGALTHFYIYGFYAILILFFYGAEWIKKQIFRNNLSLLVHLFIQLILPFLILQLFYISDHITDRPSYPWGFLYYRAYPQSVLLPMNRPYGQFLHTFINTNYIDWEGYAFAGMVALAGSIIIVVQFVQKLFRKHYSSLANVTGNRQINVLFWASFTALLYSFGLPFILGLERLIDLIGPVRQMRGIARFSWVFFYVMNIVTIYWLWNWFKEKQGWLRAAVIIAALAMLCTDAWYNVRNRGRSLENSIPALTDRQLEEPENQWIKHINIRNYQAFIPLPYFHIGSENIWIDGGCEIVNRSFIAIKNSGLPCLGVMLSRTSLSQTVENVSFMTGLPCNELHLERFPTKKPFLLLVAPCDLLNEHERQLILNATKIDSSGNFGIYELPFSAFKKIADLDAATAIRESDELKLFDHNDTFSEDSVLNYRFINYDSLNNGSFMNGTGLFRGKAKNRNELFDGFLPGNDTTTSLLISFWLYNVKGDLYPRSQVIMVETEKNGNVVKNESRPVSKQFVFFHDNSVLVEFKYKTVNSQNKFRIILQNKALYNRELDADDLLIRPETTQVYQKEAHEVRKNNRIFVLCSP